MVSFGTGAPTGGRYPRLGGSVGGGAGVVVGGGNVGRMTGF